MKNARLFMVAYTVFLLVILYACEQKDPQPTLSLDLMAGKRLLSKFDAMKDVDIQKTSFAALSNQEKNLVWQTKFADLESHKELNDTQKKLIDELKEILNPNAYVLNSNESTIARYRIEKWMDKAKDSFTDFQMYNLFFRIRSLSTEEANIEARKNTELKNSRSNQEDKFADCNCDKDSRYTCARVTEWGLSHAKVEYGDCSAGYGCRESSMGCGFGYLWTCDGFKCVFRN